MGESDPNQQGKKRAGVEAAGLVVDGQIVGLGTGSTAAFAIEELSRRIRDESLAIVGIPTSHSSAILARRGGIPLRTLDEVSQIDIAIDGADEVDPDRNLIKGGGAAHTREKVIASCSEQFVVVVDESKLVTRLGIGFPVPVEVIPMALTPVMRRLEALGGRPVLRMAERKDGPIISDEGNLIVDVQFDGIDDPGALEKEIDTIPGVLENGLFVGLASQVLIGSAGETRRLQ